MSEGDMELNFKGKVYPEDPRWKDIDKKVRAAFKELPKESIFTSAEISGSGGDGEYEIREELESAADEEDKSFVGYAYYNAFDKKEGRAFAELSINIGSYVDSETWDQDPKKLKDVGKRTAEALKAEGLKVDWDGEFSTMVVSLK